MKLARDKLKKAIATTRRDGQNRSRRELVIRGPRFFSAGDEGIFFDWLLSIPCVWSVGGRLRNVHIRLKRSPSKADLCELIAAFYRYRIDPRPLAALKTRANTKWFAEDSTAFWHSGIFRKAKRKSEK